MSLVTLLKSLVLVIVLVVVQTSILPQFFTTAFKPDLLLVLVVIMALRGGDGGGIIGSFLLGLVKDCNSSIYFGLNGFSFLVVFFLLRMMSGRLFVQSGTLISLCACGSLLVAMVSNLVLLSIFSESPGLFFSMMRGLIPALLMQALASAAMVPLVQSLFPELESR